jgi:Holliday junction resolvase RusA-like endonuclease
MAPTMTDPLWPPTPSITDGYILHFDVAGLPAPQGSKKAFVNPRTRRAIIVDANPTTLRSWRQDVIEAAKHARGNSVPLDGSLSLLVTFWLPRPQAHYGTKGLKVNAPTYSRTKPDIDKLLRAVMDALTIAGVWTDDARVGRVTMEKMYSETSGCAVTITLLDK